jgi:hypothetical protein
MTLETLLNACDHELEVCKHLYTKFDPSKADWRPQQNMRTTLELMQYLTFIGTAFARQFANPPEDRDAAREGYRDLAKQSKTLTFESFPEAIDREREDIRNAFEGLTDADLSRQTYHQFSGTEHTLLQGVITILEYLCAYRHQLFIYAKMNGAEINTLNNWYGKDPAPRS